MQSLQNLSLTPNSANKDHKAIHRKENYLFTFRDYNTADFWMKQTVDVLTKDVMFVDYHKRKICFLDCAYYFISQADVERFLLTHSHMIDYMWGVEELYIILDDPGRMYLETYFDDEPEK